MQKLHGFTDVNSDQQNQACKPRWLMTADRRALGHLRATLDSTLYDAFGQAGLDHVPP